MISLLVAVGIVCAIVQIIRWLDPPAPLRHGAYTILALILLLATLRAFGVAPRVYLFIGEPGVQEQELQQAPR
jgi:hypothetical protein